jgi:hypothetical protein
MSLRTQFKILAVGIAMSINMLLAVLVDVKVVMNGVVKVAQEQVKPVVQVVEEQVGKNAMGVAMVRERLKKGLKMQVEHTAKKWLIVLLVVARVK